MKHLPPRAILGNTRHAASILLPIPLANREDELDGEDQPPELEPDQVDGEGEEEQPKSARYTHIKFTPLENDPIDEGRELAKSGDVKLPGHNPAPKLCVVPGPVPSPAPAPSEEQQIADLYRRGILYEVVKDEAHWAGFNFDAIHPSKPFYTIKHSAKRCKRKPGADPALLGGDYVSDEVWDLVAQLSDVDSFDLVMLREAGSELESWAGSDSN